VIKPTLICNRDYKEKAGHDNYWHSMADNNNENLISKHETGFFA
jgi:hypothetical protein